MFDHRVLVRAARVFEGAESDSYRCEKGHEFGVDWRGRPPDEPQWPPSPDLIAEFGGKD